MNQGMLMESMNLASVWNLPVLFVCKDDGWAITTQSNQVTGGDLNERARGLGVPALEVDGRDVTAVWDGADNAIARARSGQGPTFLHARCVHLEGHFLGFQLLRIARTPLREVPGIAGPLTQAFLRPGGAPLRERLAGLKTSMAALLSTMRDPRQDPTNDPLPRTRATLQEEPARLQGLEDHIEHEIHNVLASALAEAPS